MHLNLTRNSRAPTCKVDNGAVSEAELLVIRPQDAGIPLVDAE